MILHNIYVKNVSLSPGKDWAVDGAAGGSPNTSTPALTIMQIVPVCIMDHGSWVTSQNCVAEMFAGMCYDQILSNIYTLLATLFSLL